MKHFIIPAFPCLLLRFIHFTIISAQSPLSAAPAPAPPAPTNITAILEKAGRFSTLIRLLKSTQSADRINTQLNESAQGLTIFAPADGAFANLTLNSYTDQEKSELVQFHTLSSFLSLPQFQTTSNPVSTEAGGTNYGEFPLNVTSSGTGGVNITTGFSNASIVSTVYTDGQLAVYEVDKVLLPQRFFIAPPPPPPIPPPAPAPSNSKKRAPLSSTASHAVRPNLMHGTFHASFLVAVLLAASWLFG